MPQQTSCGFTLIDLQSTLAKEINEALSDMRFLKASGDEVKITVYKQHLPISNESDEDDELSRAPYAIVRMTNGGKDEDEPISVNFLIIFCIYDNSPERNGHETVLNIIGRLESYLGKKSTVGNFSINPGFDFSLQDSDTHPFYYGGIQMSFDAPKTVKESTFA